MDTQKPKNGQDQPGTATMPAGKIDNTGKNADARGGRGRVPPLFRKVDWLTHADRLCGGLDRLFSDAGARGDAAGFRRTMHRGILRRAYPIRRVIRSGPFTRGFGPHLLPFGNVAWRVEVGESTAAAMACGLVALMVSRGSSMLMEGIEDLKSLTGNGRMRFAWYAGRWRGCCWDSAG